MIQLNPTFNAHHQAFDIDKLHLTTEYMYRGTVACGGRLFIQKDGQETALPMPRRYCTGMKETYYAKPIPIAVLWYGDDALGFEEIETEFVNGEYTEYTHNVIGNLEHFKQQFTGQWYFDGEFMYTLEVTQSENRLDSRNFFKLMNIPAFQPTVLFTSKYEGVSMYHGVMCMDVMSPPLWGTIDSISMTGTYLIDGDMLDKMDARATVSLQGLLKTCTVSSKLFGPESTECFDLPLYMIAHKTVNLPSLSNAVKSTSPSGITFSDALAWHIGKFYKCDCYTMVKSIKRNLKYIASYAMVKRDTLEHDNIFLGDGRPTVIKVNNDQVKS